MQTLELNAVPNINTNQAIAFLTLAETLNFTNAAAKLHTTQPNLSKLIARLEDEIQVKLFVRNKRKVSLTPAGAFLQEKVHANTVDLLTIIEDAQQISTKKQASLSIAMLGTAVLNQLPAIIKQFKSLYPSVTLHMTDYPLVNINDLLIDNSVDIAFFPEDDVKGYPELDKLVFSRDSMYLAVNKENPLCKRKTIDLEEAAGQNFIVPDVTILTDIFAKKKITPKITYEPNSTLNTILLMIKSGIGVSIFAGHLRRYISDDIVFIKLNGFENYFKIDCIWKNDYDPAVLNFIKIVKASVGGSSLSAKDQIKTSLQ
ncbi:MAG: LysR family transcriptional regulator [Enterococcaceae bacterium]|jgi:DNA-binding transcriptional LysR family regulator|nr:LysR family transcriptional regulator [Enterococcaceae bacterium]MCI1918702.1 LysR family transcriptional regulator [Enterococcaceae bacterium]